MFSLLGMECIGACDMVPCALVNGTQYNKLTISRIDELINECKEEG